MTTRSEIDKRLELINEATVTDEEYAALTIPGSPTTTDYYDLCSEILTSRGSVGATFDRLNSLAFALDSLSYNSTERSETNIFLGADLGN